MKIRNKVNAYLNEMQQAGLRNVSLYLTYAMKNQLSR